MAVCNVGTVNLHHVHTTTAARADAGRQLAEAAAHRAHAVDMTGKVGRTGKNAIGQIKLSATGRTSFSQRAPPSRWVMEYT